MRITEKYKEDLMALYSHLKSNILLFSNYYNHGRGKAIDVRAAFCNVYDIMGQFIQLRKDYIEDLEDPNDDVDPGDFDYVYAWAMSPLTEYCDAKKYILEQEGRIKKEERRMMLTLFQPCSVIKSILEEANFIGCIYPDLCGEELPDSLRPHFLTEEELRFQKEVNERKALREEEEMPKRHITDTNDYEAIVAFLAENAERKTFIHPETKEECHYYKYEGKYFTSEGRRFGYAKIREWNLVDEM